MSASEHAWIRPRPGLRLGFRWTALTAALAVLATAGFLWSSGRAQALSQYLVADADLVSRGEWWRVLTGPLIHTTAYHLIWDLGILLAIGIFYEARMRAIWPWLLFFGMTVPTAGVFHAHPDISFYYGTSGLTHAAMAAVVVFELSTGRRCWWGVAAGVALAGKIVWGLFGPGSLIDVELGSSVREVPVAHLVGVTVGAEVALCAHLAQRAIRRGRPRWAAPARSG